MKKLILLWTVLMMTTVLLTGCTQSTTGTESFYSTELEELLSEEGVGSQGYLVDPSHPHQFDSKLFLENNSFTLSFWIRPDANFLWTTLFSMGRDEEHFMQLATSGNPEGQLSGINLTVRYGKKEKRILSEPENTLETGVFNHVALVWNRKSVSLYLNGHPVAEGKVPVTPKKMKTEILSVGRSLFFEDPQLTGVFQDLKITDRALSEKEIMEEVDRQYPLMVLDTLEFAHQDDQRDNLFPKTYEQKEGLWIGAREYRGVSLSFTSSDPQWISDYGEVTFPEELQQDHPVTVTAHAEYKGQTVTRDFVFDLLADSDATRLKRDLEAVQSEFTGLVNEQDILPSVAPNGSELMWSVVFGEIELKDNRIIKKVREPRIPARLRVQLKSGDQREVREQDVVVLDEFTGYILSYFNGEEGQERGKLAYSRDGLHWTALNGGEPVFSSDLGNGRIRDPYIGRDSEGNFVVLATEGFDNPSIYIWRSPDLIDLSDHRLVPVALWDPYMHLSGKRAWAPEMIYDPVHKEYEIVFSDPEAGDDSALYSVTTKDFQSFSYPSVFFKPGYAVIDGTFVRTGGKTWLFYKDERQAAQTVYYASSDAPQEPFDTVYDDHFLLDIKYMEGPFILENNQKESFYLYEDHFPHGVFHVGEFTRLSEDPDIRWLDPSEYSMPEEGVRHGSALSVTEEELQKLIEYYK